MINQLEIPMYIEEALPEICHDLSVAKKANAYDAMDALTSFTNKNIREHNYNVVKRCFKVADKLYSKGNATVRNAVQNVFVYSLTNMFHGNAAEKKQVLAIIPMTLYSLYLAQLYRSGC